jgi:hypothetical protein
MIEKKLHNLQEWFEALVEVLGELIKECLVLILKVIVGLVGLFIFIVAYVKIGWTSIPICIVLVFLGYYIYDRLTEEKGD